MLRLFSVCLMFTLVMISCGEPQTTVCQDSVSVQMDPAQDSMDNSPYGIARLNLLTILPTWYAPASIDVDTIQDYNIIVSHAVVTMLFPEGFDVPSNVQVTAIAQQDIDAVNDAIWYHMTVKSNDGPDNQDVWMVLYNDTAGPTAAHCFATKGVGSGQAKMDSKTSFREVFVNGTEEVIVTTKTVTIENGKFIIHDEQTKTFPKESDVHSASKEYIREFFK